MIEFTFYDYISNAILGNDWSASFGSAFLIIMLYNWACTFFIKQHRSQWLVRNFAGFMLLFLYTCYFIFIYMHFRGAGVKGFDYARLIVAILAYSIGFNIYYLVKLNLEKLQFFKQRKLLTGFFVLFFLCLIYNHLYIWATGYIQNIINNTFYNNNGIRPISNRNLNISLFYLYKYLESAFIFASANTIINNFLSRLRNKSYNKELEISEIKNQLLKTQIESLNSRINPHFLYNTLNSIAALTLTDTTKSRKMIIMLSKLFRYNVNREEEAFASVEEEIEMINSYLDIEKIRFEENLLFDIAVTKEARGLKMPRFLLQPLIENAIKYGLNNNDVLKIKINIFIQDKQLTLQVIDNGKAFVDNFVPGYGFKSIYDKLDLLYTDRYEVSIIKAPEKMVEVRIDQKV